MRNRFFRYELRTTDVPAARRFYADLFGARFWSGEVLVAPLPERAAALGVPAHWLGHISTTDVEDVANRLAALGGQRLGPTPQGSDGSSKAVLRDPFGAVLSLSSEPTPADGTPVVWHLHHSRDHREAFSLYSTLFGWTATEAWEPGPEGGSLQAFAWNESGEVAGAMANIARLPHIHPQWLFFFEVDDLEEALVQVRAGGGKTLEPMRTANGDTVAPCDDPQGAAFALYQLSE